MGVGRISDLLDAVTNMQREALALQYKALDEAVRDLTRTTVRASLVWCAASGTRAVEADKRLVSTEFLEGKA